MKCADCRWYNLENEVCLKDGYSVFNPGADDPCEYVDNMTVFDRITQSPEVLAKELVTLDCDSLCFAWVGIGRREAFSTRDEAIAATVAKLKEVAK